MTVALHQSFEMFFQALRHSHGLMHIPHFDPYDLVASINGLAAIDNRHFPPRTNDICRKRFLILPCSSSTFASVSVLSVLVDRARSVKLDNNRLWSYRLLYPSCPPDEHG